MARLEPLPRSDWPPEMADAMAALRPATLRHPLPVTKDRPKGLNILGTLAHHPELARAYHTLNGHILFGSTLSVRLREVIILRVAAVRNADYEWGQHVIQGADAGLSDDEIERIAEGPAADGWEPFEKAVLSAVDELIADARITDDTWATLAAELDTRQIMDLIFTVGAYDLLAMAMCSFGLELDDDLREFLESR